MSSNRALNAFLTSAAALGGLYLLDRFMSRGDDSRENPKKTYKHVKGYEEFTDTEKQQIADEYTLGQKSVAMLYIEHRTTARIIERILREKEVTLRDKIEAARLKNTVTVTPAQIDTILRMWNPPFGKSRATLDQLCEATGLKTTPVLRILKEHAGYQGKPHEEISDEDKEKLRQGKIKERNKTGPRLVLKRVDKQLDLSRLPSSPLVILRFFAQEGLNDPSDYSGSLTPEQQDAILLHFRQGQTLTLGQLAENLGTTAAMVRVFLFYNNIIPRDKSTFNEMPLTEEEKAEIIRLYDEGNTNEQIMVSTSISITRVSAFIKELRKSRGLTESRVSESNLRIRPSLITRHPLVIKKIMEARSQTPPVSFQEIADELNEEMPKEEGFERFSIAKRTVEEIYREQMRNA